MALAPGDSVTNVAQCTFSGLLPDSEIFSHRVHVAIEGIGPLDQPSLSDIADGMATHITEMLAAPITGGLFSTLAGLWPNGVQWTRLTARALNVATGAIILDPEYRELTDAGTGGTGAADSMPNQIAWCITLRRGSFGRRNRNRWYLPPIVVSARGSTPSRIGSAYVTAMADWLPNEQTRLAGTASGMQLCVYSPTAHDANVATDCFIGDTLDTIRRRRNRIVEARTTELV